MLVLVQFVMGPGLVDEDQTRNDRRVSDGLRSRFMSGRSCSRSTSTSSIRPGPCSDTPIPNANSRSHVRCLDPSRRRRHRRARPQCGARDDPRFPRQTMDQGHLQDCAEVEFPGGPETGSSSFAFMIRLRRSNRCCAASIRARRKAAGAARRAFRELSCKGEPIPHRRSSLPNLFATVHAGLMRAPSGELKRSAAAARGLRSANPRRGCGSSRRFPSPRRESPCPAAPPGRRTRTRAKSNARRSIHSIPSA